MVMSLPTAKPRTLVGHMGTMLPATKSELYIFLSIFLTFVVYFKFLSRDKRLNKLLEQLPGPPALPILGNALNFVVPSTKYLGLVHGMIQKYGRVMRLWILNEPYVMLASAKEFEKILSSPAHVEKSRDYFVHKPWLGNALNLAKRDEWLPRRRLLNPSFQFRFLDGFMDVFNEQSTILKNLLDKDVVGNGAVDMFPYCCRCTFDIICESAMGTKIGSQTNKNTPYLTTIISLSKLIVHRILRPWYHPDWIWKISSPGRQAKKCTQTLIQFTNKLIFDRKKFLSEKSMQNSEPCQISQAKDGDDLEDDVGDSKKPQLAFLDLLLKMQETHGKSFLSDIEIRNETDLFMVAGHETSGSSMAWTLFMLASHPEVQRKLQDELDLIFEEDRDRPVTIADLGKLKYLDMCVKESLRICPPIPVIFRHIHQDIPIDDDKVIPRGTSIALNILELHRDPSVFPDPLKFDPERFRPENCLGRSPYAFVPFAAGPRNCIGIRFALMEGKVILATLLRNFWLETDEKFENLEISPDISLRPRNGLHLRISRRQ